MKKKIILTGIIMLLICSMTTFVKAAEEKITFEASKEELKSGDTFVITVSAKSTDGLNLISANFEYDETILELVERGDMPTGFADWSGADANEIVVMASSSPKTEANITLTFKVKSNVADNTTTEIKFTDVGMDTFAETDHKFLLDDSTVTLKINTQVAEEPTTPTEPEEPTTPTEPETPTIQITQDEPKVQSEQKTSVDTTTSSGKMPQTGEGISINAILVLITLVAIAVGSFIAYRRYKDIY